MQENSHRYNISNTQILNKKVVKLPGLNLEGRFNFVLHVNTLKKKHVKSTVLLLGCAIASTN